MFPAAEVWNLGDARLGCSLCNRQVLHTWGGLEHGGLPWPVAPGCEDKLSCTTAPLPWAVGLGQCVSPRSHTDSQYGLAKCLFTPHAGLDIPRFGSGNCPCLVAESVFKRTLPPLRTNPQLNFWGWGTQSSLRFGHKLSVYCRKDSCIAKVEQSSEPRSLCTYSDLFCMFTL